MKAVLSIAALAAASSVASAAFTTYENDFAGWAAAVGGYVTETFTGNVINTGAFTITTLTGSIAGNQFEDRLERAQSTTLTFGSAITAWGGDFDFTPGGPGVGLILFANGQQVGSILNPDPNTPFSGFWGFTSSVAFDTVRIDGNGQTGVAETYSLDNVVFTPAPGAAVLAFIGAAGFARRRR